MTLLFEEKDNEFIAWYPSRLEKEQATSVWEPKRAGYYIHIPFCSAICHYCGFAVDKVKKNNLTEYFDTIRREIELCADAGHLSNHRIVCGHFGGGTPSAVPHQLLCDLKRFVDQSFQVDEDIEVTVEVNPISFTPEKAEEYAKSGFNRLSVGIQSFNEQLLKRIGRPYKFSDLEDTLKTVKLTGWQNFSVDIIYGIPGQTMEELRDDLLRAIDTGAVHLSCFRLEIIPFTLLALREGAGEIPPRLSREILDEMDDLVVSVLESNGLKLYGSFNFARPGYESVHNDVAFQAPQGDYIGFGNSAYSCINGHIYCNHASVPDYLAAMDKKKSGIAFATRVSAREAMSRFFVLGLKMLKVEREPFRSQFGFEPEEIFGELLSQLISHRMLELSNDCYHLTSLGRKYVNNICKTFYTEENADHSQFMQFVPNIDLKQVMHYEKIANQKIANGVSALK